jgi:hypothetical protein
MAWQLPHAVVAGGGGGIVVVGGATAKASAMAWTSAAVKVLVAYGVVYIRDRIADAATPLLAEVARGP